MRSAVIFLASTMVLACGGVDGGIIGNDQDSGSGNSDGGGGNDAQPLEGGPNCDISKCAAVPAGFHAVRPAGAKATCPDGWDSAEVVSNPIVSDGVCTCGCNITTPPDCNTGNIIRYSDGTSTATCGAQGYQFTAPATGCTAMGVALYLNQYHYSVTGPAAVGGVCEFDATADTSKVKSTASQLCTPPTSCQGAICNDNGPVCVAQDGDVACPSSFPTKTLVGASATADCSACSGSCAVSGTCSGKFSTFTDGACSMNKVDFTADGSCVANPTSNIGPYYYYEYAGSVASAACKGSATSTGTGKLDGASTVCCKQ